MKKYDEVFKQRIVYLYLCKGMPVVYLSEKYVISKSSIYSWSKKSLIKKL